MNNYKDYIKTIDDNAHLISMVPVQELLRFAYEAGLNEESKVLDLCCGYGTLLKIWNEAFGINGVGVDRESYFINVGKERLEKSGADGVRLVCEEVTVYRDNEKYDVVICSETIGSIADTLKLGEKFLKTGGMLAYQKLYSKVAEPPEELVEFDYEVLPLSELNRIFNENGYYLTVIASDNDSTWEKYVTASNRGDIERLIKDPSDTDLREDIDYWYNMYFNYRRPYEGQALFGLRKVFD
ncbi:MAG: class I SAM-dependent methyltransferase [Clostridia bacterium]|nr:class I SAM-dependent methyltransferase [Clostridia bacterium]